MIKIWETPDSRDLSGESYLLRHRVSGTTDAATARNYGIGATPALVNVDNGILYRQDVNVTPDGWQLWDLETPYGPAPTVNGGGSGGAGASFRWSFDTTGGTVRIRTSKMTTKFPSTAHDFKNAIDVQDGIVNGIDVVIPVLKLNVEFDYPLGILTLAHAKAIASITGKVSSKPFLAFAGGEVLFLGGSGSDGTNVAATGAFQFAVSPNQSGLTIGDIAGISKPGWDAIWISFKDAEDADHVVRQPEAAYVERVYDTADLAAVLGFG